jgi:para-nitrobenzyl esterase
MDTQTFWRSGGWRVGARLCAGAIAIGTLAATVTAIGASATTTTDAGTRAAPVVSTAGGVVRGKTAGTADEFLGIPYAAPPVGPLRWRAPQPAARWLGVRDATQFGANCPQPASPFGIASTSETCLYLNVFAPAGRQQSGAGRPVMVWIHGGGLRIGESNDYNPTKLVADGTLVVTHQLPGGRARLPRSPGPGRAPGRLVRELRPDGPASRAALGAAEYPSVRR